MLTLGLLSGGCGKKEATTSPRPEAAVERVADASEVAEPAATATPTAPTAPKPQGGRVAARQPNPPAAQPQAVQVEALEGAVQPFMTIQLHKFIQDNGRMPKSFSEFANTSMDSVPFAPQGMEYAIDYANKQVKLVKIKKR